VGRPASSRYRVRRRRRRFGTVPALLLLALGIALAVIPWPEAFVETTFARGLFPVTSHVLAPLVGAVPWSLTATLALALVVVGVASLPGAAGRRFLRRALLPWSAALLVVGFMLVWGLAYRRATLAQLLGLPPGPVTTAEIATARARLLAVVRSTEASAPPRAADVAAAGRCVAREVERVTGSRVDVPSRVKLLPAGTLLRFGFAGVTSPWLLEPHVDAGLPAVARLATATHELTHTAGFAREADTDALAVLAGLRCNDPAVRYALAVHGIDLLLTALPPGDARALVAALPERALQDLRAASEAAVRYRVPWLQRAATATYGTYLRSRGVSAGMGDYGRATTLVVKALARGLL
jgi:energy-coupling factor transporter transmembrane protein EcfT